jgi:hypothetical protein
MFGNAASTGIMVILQNGVTSARDMGYKRYPWRNAESGDLSITRASDISHVEAVLYERAEVFASVVVPGRFSASRLNSLKIHLGFIPSAQCRAKVAPL